ncbi:MAG: endo-1,4-beta-xylanase [Treponema sp.]|nr:endo-1,4-beta-xylanase [Treponema sp.]
MRKTFLKHFRGIALLCFAGMALFSSCNQTVSGTESNTGGTGSSSEKSWDKVDSLKNAYIDSGIFDHFGFAATLSELKGLKETNEKDNSDIPDILSKHGNTTTLGNEAKPQWILWYYNGTPSHTASFTASNGKIIDVPDSIPTTNDKEHGLGGLGEAMKICMDKGIQMRGHVLTWHSQTFDWFFCKDYDVSKGLTDKDTMTARHEWYIKTVLEYVQTWEDANLTPEWKTAHGNHIIYTWDVVNEAVADDALSTEYIRGSTPGTNTDIPALAVGCPEGGTSRWYQIYQSDEFIINAFRFANKYAPSDVTLCYNDYNEYMDWANPQNNSRGIKRTGIIKLLESILSHKNDATLPTRLDAFGMQSHFSDWVSFSGVEDSIKKYLALGIDLQVTELDFTWNENTYSDANSKGYSGTKLEDLYKDHMKLYIKYAKSKRQTEGNGITSVTFWATEDQNNWLNNVANTYYPSLFTRDTKGNIVAKEAFFAVLNAAKQ